MSVKYTPLGEKSFINPETISPFISKFTIKVAYLGMDINNGYMTKEFMDILAGTLRGSCIVGKYDDLGQDFTDHEATEIITNDGKRYYKFDTRPYGFIDLNAKIWYQDFEEETYQGGTAVRRYLCTEGYIWTGIYPESRKLFEGRNGQSLQLDPKTLSGEWAKDFNTGQKYYIYNDGKLTSLCILGEDIPPCFEGADFQPVNTNFQRQEEGIIPNEVIIAFSAVMREELKKGQLIMGNNATINEVSTENIEEPEVAAVDGNTTIETDSTKSSSDQANEKNKSEEEETDSEKSSSGSPDNKRTEGLVEEAGNIEPSSEEVLQSLVKQMMTLTNAMSDLSKKVDENTRIEEKPQNENSDSQETEKTEKEELITTFSALSTEAMKKIMSRLDNNREKEVGQNDNSMNTNPQLIFSAVNNVIENRKEDVELPEFMKEVLRQREENLL